MRLCTFASLLLTAALAGLASPATPSLFAQESSPDAQATSANGSFSSEALNLRFNYPSALERRDPAEAIGNGHLTILGLAAANAPSQQSVAACLRPLLLARTPAPAQPAATTEQPAPDGSTAVRVTPANAGTLLLAELDLACLSGHEGNTRTDLLSTMAQQFVATPGMQTLAPPARYNTGWQKVTMAAAQGHPQTPPPPGSDSTVQPASSPFTVFTMAIATNWNNHLLVWLMSANQIQLLDQLSKSTVRFGRSAAAPLYPQPLGNASPAGSPQ